MTWHHFFYGASRTGKTTLAAQAAKRGLFTLAITLEPGVTKVAFDDAGALDQLKMFVPDSDQALLAFLDYPEAYLDRFFNGLRPELVLFDNLQGIQHLIIGRPPQPATKVGGLEIPAKPATGIVGNIPKSAGGDEKNPEALSVAQYGVLGRYTRRLLNAVDSLPFNTIITTTEQYDFDEKYKKDAQGRKPTEAAGRPRKVKGWPATEGSMAKHMLPSCVSGAVLHLVKDESKPQPVYQIHTRTHTDRDGVEWFADPRGLGKLDPTLTWTGKDGAELLNLAKTT